jgi:allantoicase
MFEELYDAVSRLWSCRWPLADGEVTEVILDRIRHRGNSPDTIRLAIAYEFSVGSDGPYTGESFWRPLFPSMKRVQDAKRKFHRHQRVIVRYRSDDPSVNRLDGRVWQDL